MADARKPSSALRQKIIEHPEAILEDPEVMSALISAEAPKERNVVDLRGTLVHRLETRLTRLQESKTQVIAAAYENLAGTNQVHRSVLSLLDNSTFRGFLATLGDEVAHILSVDAIRLGVETQPGLAGRTFGPSTALAHLIVTLPPGGVEVYAGGASGTAAAGRVTLRRATEITGDVFGPGERWIESEAVLRLDLGPGRRPALLALGSVDGGRFSPDQAGDLLGFFAGSVERMLRRWLA